MRVVFSKIANQTYEDILEFLSYVWTEKEMNIFITDVFKIVEDLENGNFLRFQKFNKTTRSALIGKNHIRMFFRKEMDKIRILLFFDMRQNPEKIINLLKQ